MVPCELPEDGTAEELSLSANVVGMQAASGQLNPTPIVPATGGAVVPTVEGTNDQVNQAWFTTKEDKDSLHGKGVLARKDKPSYQAAWKKCVGDLRWQGGGDGGKVGGLKKVRKQIVRVETFSAV